KVFINYADQVFGPYAPDENGGVLIEVSLLDQAGVVKIEAQSETTGKIVEEAIEVADKTPPEIFIISPRKDQDYINNQILLLDFRVIDNQSEELPLKTKIFLNGDAMFQNAIDLSLQKTGNHRLEIVAEDEGGNIGRTELDFANIATVNSIIANISHYYDLKVIKLLSARNTLLAAAKSLKLQLDALGKLKQSALPPATKNYLITLAQNSINRQIDAMIALIGKLPAISIDASAKELLIDSLRYIKIK
ncbi:MAG TPA: hypothetical protein PKK37_04735, partial [Candidatus Pacearchaeota archaeon]|nr:hypothetical protein [Candidatus Pacearchaeota archaeon]